MQTQLLAMLILASWVQERGDARRRPEPAGRRVTVNVRVAAGYREIRQVTVTIPAPPAPADEDDPPPQPVRRLNINDLPPQPVRRLNINDAVVDRENFDRWLFEAEPAEESRQRHLDHLLRARVEAAARRHTLTAPQRAKLLLAGKGDIKRFFDQVEDKRRDFEAERKTYRTGLAALRRLEPLIQLYREGPFGEDSLIAKTLQRMIDDKKSGL